MTWDSGLRSYAGVSFCKANSRAKSSKEYQSVVQQSKKGQNRAGSNKKLQLKEVEEPERKEQHQEPQDAKDLGIAVEDPVGEMKSPMPEDINEEELQAMFESVPEEINWALPTDNDDDSVKLDEDEFDPIFMEDPTESKFPTLPSQSSHCP